MNRRRWMIGLAVVALGLTVGLSLRDQRPTEPSYQGKPATYWMKQLFDRPYGDSAAANYQALAKMGVAVEPYAVAALKKVPWWRQDPRYAQTLGRLPRFIRDQLPSPPTPEEFNDGDRRSRVVQQILHNLGPALDSFLPSLARDRSILVRRVAVELLRSDHAPADDQLARKLVYRLMRDRDHLICVLALMASQRFDDSVIPRLIAATEERSDLEPRAMVEVRVAAARELSLRGERARAAIPTLRQLARDSSARTRRFALIALLRIERSHETVLTVLNELNGATKIDTEITREMVSALGSLGPDAHDAAPIVLKIWKTSEHVSSVPAFDRMMTDDLRNAAAETLKQIAPEVAAREGIQ